MIASVKKSSTTTSKRSRSALADFEAPPTTTKRTRGAPTVTILHMCPPIVVHAQPSEFRNVVQKLTGLRAATPAAEPPAPLPDSPQTPLPSTYSQQYDDYVEEFYRPEPPSPPSSHQNPTASSSTTSCTSFQYNNDSNYPASSPAYSNSTSCSIAEPLASCTDTDDDAQFINPGLSSSIYSDLHSNLSIDSAFFHQQLVSPAAVLHQDELFTVDDLMSCLGQYRC